MHRAIHKTRMVRSNENQAQVELTSKIPNLLKVVVLGQRIKAWAKLFNPLWHSAIFSVAGKPDRLAASKT
jgi:hypothetical protein